LNPIEILTRDLVLRLPSREGHYKYKAKPTTTKAKKTCANSTLLGSSYGRWTCSLRLRKPKTGKDGALDNPVLVAAVEEAEDSVDEAGFVPVVVGAKLDAATELPGVTGLVATAPDAEVKLTAKIELSTRRKKSSKSP
jgi:hypothetical protein